MRRSLSSMRKSLVCAIAAAAMLAVSGTVPAYAAVSTVNIPGGKVIQISGSGSRLDCSQQLQKMLGSLLQQPGTFQPEAGRPEIQQPEEGTDESAFAKEILNLVNAERSKAGLSPVTLHSSASRAAQVRAQEIQTSFSHTRPGGGSAASALNEAGVSYHGFGENIAYGQNSAEEVMREWMNSPGHRANILNANFTSLGVGHTENAAGVDYWVQLFLY